MDANCLCSAWIRIVPLCACLRTCCCTHIVLVLYPWKYKHQSKQPVSVCVQSDFCFQGMYASCARAPSLRPLHPLHPLYPTRSCTPAAAVALPTCALTPFAFPSAHRPVTPASLCCKKVLLLLTCATVCALSRCDEWALWASHSTCGST